MMIIRLRERNLPNLICTYTCRVVQPYYCDTIGHILWCDVCGHSCCVVKVFSMTRVQFTVANLRFSCGQERENSENAIALTCVFIFSPPNVLSASSFHARNVFEKYTTSEIHSTSAATIVPPIYLLFIIRGMVIKFRRYFVTGYISLWNQSAAKPTCATHTDNIFASPHLRRPSLCRFVAFNKTPLGFYPRTLLLLSEG